MAALFIHGAQKRLVLDIFFVFLTVNSAIEAKKKEKKKKIERHLKQKNKQTD